MIHHDNRTYAVAHSEAASKARVKLDEFIQRHARSANTVVERVQSETPFDKILTSDRLVVGAGTDGGFTLGVRDHDSTGAAYELHDHAFRQIAQHAGVPAKYLTELQTERGAWGNELALHNLNTILRNSEPSRHLVRYVRPMGTDKREVRGFLSDRYRRLDSRPLLESFVTACQSIGAIAVEGYSQDTRIKVRAVLPQVYEPLPNEPMVFGLEWGNSDFGHGGHYVSLWVMRMWCTNLAIGESCLRQVHLGKRLDDDIEYSRRTLELDTQTNSSALSDVVKHSIGPKQIQCYVESVRKVADKAVEGKDVATLLKDSLQKSEIEKVKSAFESPDEVNLPKGNSVYRLSNALSWIAQSEGLSTDRKLELQRKAGELLGAKDAVKAREV